MLVGCFVFKQFFSMYFQWTGLHDGIVTCCQISHDGQYIATGSDLDGAIRLWSVKDGQLIKKVKGNV